MKQSFWGCGWPSDLLVSLLFGQATRCRSWRVGSIPTSNTFIFFFLFRSVLPNSDYFQFILLHPIIYFTCAFRNVQNSSINLIWFIAVIKLSVIGIDMGAYADTMLKLQTLFLTNLLAMF